MKKVLIFASSAEYMLSFFDQENFPDDLCIEVFIHKDIKPIPFENVQVIKGLGPYTVTEEAQREIEAIIKKEIDAGHKPYLYSYNEILLPVLVKFREKYELFGNKPHGLDYFCDKLALKKKLNLSCIDSPKYIQVGDKSIEGIKSLVNSSFSYPVIYKAKSGFGSRNVYKVNNESELLSLLAETWLDKDDYLIEEYINGKLFHIDIAVRESEIVHLFVSEYGNPLLEIKYAKNIGSIPVFGNQYDEMKTFLLSTKDNLDLSDGVYHIEVFKDENGLKYMLEISERPGGAYIVEVYKNTYGINLLNFDLSVNIDAEISEIGAHTSYSAWIYTAKIPGIFDRIKKMPIQSSMEIKWELKLGATMDYSKFVGDKSSVMLLSSDNYDDLLSDYYQIINTNVVECMAEEVAATC